MYITSEIGISHIFREMVNRLTLRISKHQDCRHRISVQPLHGSRTGSVRFPLKACGDCTVTALKLYDFRTISAQPPYGFVPISPPESVQKSHDTRI